MAMLSLSWRDKPITQKAPQAGVLSWSGDCYGCPPPTSLLPPGSLLAIQLLISVSERLLALSLHHATPPARLPLSQQNLGGWGLFCADVIAGSYCWKTREVGAIIVTIIGADGEFMRIYGVGHRGPLRVADAAFSISG